MSLGSLKIEPEIRQISSTPHSKKVLNGKVKTSPLSSIFHCELLWNTENLALEFDIIANYNLNMPFPLILSTQYSHHRVYNLLHILLSAQVLSQHYLHQPSTLQTSSQYTRVLSAHYVPRPQPFHHFPPFFYCKRRKVKGTRWSTNLKLQHTQYLSVRSVLRCKFNRPRWVSRRSVELCRIYFCRRRGIECRATALYKHSLLRYSGPIVFGRMRIEIRLRL